MQLGCPLESPTEAWVGGNFNALSMAQQPSKGQRLQAESADG